MRCYDTRVIVATLNGSAYLARNGPGRYDSAVMVPARGALYGVRSGARRRAAFA